MVFSLECSKKYSSKTKFSEIYKNVPYCDKNVYSKSVKFISTNTNILCLFSNFKQISAPHTMKDKSLKKNRMLRKDDYIGETERYLLTRWGEYKNPTHDSQLVHHLKNT